MPDPCFRGRSKLDWTIPLNRERVRRGTRQRDEDIREVRERIDHEVDSTTRAMANMQILARGSAQISAAAPTPAESVSSTPTVMRKPLQIAANSERKSIPPAQSCPYPKLVESPMMAQMKDGVRMIGDHLDFFDTVNEYLSDVNTNFNIIGAIGPQGVGKSTILSMLGGNDAMDMYRQYIFRPSSREAIESSRFQTGCLYLYVTKNRTILIDMQGLNSSGILDDAIRLCKSSKMDERLDTTKHMEALQIISFILHVSHTVLLCVDWFIDIEVVRTLRTAELLRANLPHVQMSSSHGVLPQLSTSRKVNLVLIHCRAKASDFSKIVMSRRRNFLRALFADSPRIKIPDNDEVAYFLTADIKLRKDPHASSLHSHSGSSLCPVAAERLLEKNTVETIENGLRKLRFLLAEIQRDEFTKDGQGLTEKQWFRMAKGIFTDTTFNGAAAKLAGYF